MKAVWIFLMSAMLSGMAFANDCPDFRLNGAERLLSFKLVGSNGCDTALLVNDAGGQWHYDDDTSGLDPVIKLNRAPSGVYDIWFVNIASGLCNAVLEIETF